ncbi:MAG: sigma 54-interacting transcriptional regulator [Ignavibacteria bacterium]|nr:sigma 54-interacting transcriptional regulator [Ignavibacteria bacterium]
METKVKGSEQKGGSQVQYPIIGKSKAADQLLKQIARLSQTRRHVLIIGEAGVGKGAVAKNLYYQSLETFKNQPFASVNLAVADDRELEAMLFGTPRTEESLVPSGKKVLEDMKHGGNILIEEIEEASFRNQMRILDFINNRIENRSGTGDGPAIRLLITLKADPVELVEKRKLLEDLFRKISDFERIEIPPLRQRPEDIPLLVKHFSSELCRDLGIGELVIDINAIDVLVRQPWRENIRELKAVVDKSVLFSNDGRFMLPPELVDEKTEVVKMINNIMSGQEFVLDRSLDVIEKGIIERALERFGFNQSRAAQFLGMTEQTFRYKLKRLGIASARMRS